MIAAMVWGFLALYAARMVYVRRPGARLRLLPAI
jgi:hypothetical protein